MLLKYFKRQKNLKFVNDNIHGDGEENNKIIYMNSICT